MSLCNIDIIISHPCLREKERKKETFIYKSPFNPPTISITFRLANITILSPLKPVNMVSERNPSKHVCVIGAGPSGLVAARELRKEGHRAVVMEQNHDIGGQWLYEPKVEDEDGLGRTTFLKVHSSIYASLRLFSPREIMGFSDFPFVVKKGRDMRRFPGHRELLLYLHDFCEWFGLREMIRFRTRVEYVGMLDSDNQVVRDLKWVVKTRDMESEKVVVVEEVFDAVVVANGHYSKPRLPSIKGIYVNY